MGVMDKFLNYMKLNDEPSIVILLQSKKRMSLPSPKDPASEQAS